MTVDKSTTSETEEKQEPKQEETKQPETGKTDKPNDIVAMEAALKKANREAEAARRKLKEIEDAGKSETDKLREEAAAAKKEAEQIRQDNLRLKVGIAKSVPKSLIPRLKGETEEEMEADADALLAELKPGAPSGDAEGGKRGDSPDPKGDMNSLLRAAARGE